MADLVGCVKDIGKWILTQFVHFVYCWWCFDDNIKGLKSGIEELKWQKHDIEQKWEEARLLTHILRPEVEEWLKASTEKLEKAQKILLPDHNIPKAWNITSRYSMGKRAKETAEEIAKLLNDGNFNPIAYPAPPAAMGSPFHRPTVDFESRKSIEKNIIYSLKKSSVDMIGICGMGGVGKTTMAQRIEKRVKEENLFDEVVMVTVSQTMDMPKIQIEIAELLKLKFDESTMSARAYQLRTRLMDAKRKIIILDDVWESLRFEDLGIPIECNFERCKVVLTSRSRDTCKTIKNKVVFDLKILEEEEAWILFKEKAGKCIENSTLRSVAKDVVAECKGLPIALVTVGMALQDESSIYKWKDSLSQLKKSNPNSFPEVLKNVYNPLKLSYDYLENDRKRDLFLMCCLFPEDYEIPINQLTLYSMGLQLFDDITNIEEARNRTHSLVENLKSRSLLIAGEDKIQWLMVHEGKLHVKMHDVVRDVAIYIGSRKNNGFLKSLHGSSIENPCDVNCNWMSVDFSNEQMEVPLLSRFPKLRLLMLLKLSSNQFSDISFEGMEALNVLSLQSISIPSLPPTMGSLENLQTLSLFRCEVQNISVIGNLTSLKIFSCYYCENITELPAEIGRLKGLRLLELNGCGKLQRIPFGIISSLSLLEELKILKSFSEWETGGERRNASLTELEGLLNLTCLEIHISDCTLSAQEILLPQKLVRYRIRIGFFHDAEHTYSYEKVMILNLPGAVGNWIQLLARNAESLCLTGDGSDNINLAEMENLWDLKFWRCSTVQKLVYTSNLSNLKSVNISGCSNLKHIFSVSVARTRLLQLESLVIQNCVAMEQVFWNEIKDNNTDGCIEFPKLKELELENLPNLTAFCQGLENIIIVKFPNLTRMWIISLPKLISLFCNPKDLLQLEVLTIGNCESMEQVFWNEIKDNNTDGCIEFPKLKTLYLLNLPNLTAFCQGLENIIVKFPNLSEMEIKGLPKLISLSPPNSETVENTCFHSFWINPKDLLQLEFLWIQDCESMEQVLWNEIKDNNTYGCIEFPKLKRLILSNLPNLTAFCQGLENIIIKFPNLRRIRIDGLPKLISLSPPNSETVENTCFHLFRNPKDISQLGYLTIRNCESLEQVFWNEIKDNNTYGCIEFPKLWHLCLHNLPNLTAFCQGLENIIIKFPNLTDMEIGGLPKLNSLSPLNSETVVRHDDNTCFHFVCNPKVEMFNLKNLTLFGSKDTIIKNIWCSQISSNFFNNLETLHISDMNDIRSLISTSIAKSLVSLKDLYIVNCEEMVEVIETGDHNDKQTVDINCLFPNLKSLEIKGMPELKRFWQWNHALELPLLKNMKIWNCPAMETFTLGSVNTPNLREIYVNFKNIKDHKDLNEVIRNIWTKCHKSKAKEDGDEDKVESKDD